MRCVSNRATPSTSTISSWQLPQGQSAARRCADFMIGEKQLCTRRDGRQVVCLLEDGATSIAVCFDEKRMQVLKSSCEMDLTKVMHITSVIFHVHLLLPCAMTEALSGMIHQQRAEAQSAPGQTSAGADWHTCSARVTCLAPCEDCKVTSIPLLKSISASCRCSEPHQTTHSW